MGSSVILMMKAGTEVRMGKAMDVQPEIAAIRKIRQRSLFVSLLVTLRIALG